MRRVRCSLHSVASDLTARETEAQGRCDLSLCLTGLGLEPEAAESQPSALSVVLTLKNQPVPAREA